MTRTSRAHSGLSPELFLAAYRSGYFPMARGKTGAVGFFMYDPRGILPLDASFKVRRSLQQVIRSGRYDVRFDTAVEQVLRACARHDTVTNDEVWLSNEMIDVYLELSAQGIVHTVEAWLPDESGGEDKLVGGLYGLSIGSAFCGESMFSRAPYASQVALVSLVQHLRERGFTLLDAQMAGEHLKQFGLVEIGHEAYLHKLKEALETSASF